TINSCGHGGNGSRGAVVTAICRGRASGPCSRDTLCRQPRSSTSTMSPERSLRVKNRMRVIRTSGSVRGGDGNIPAYSAGGLQDRTRRAGALVKLAIAFIGVSLEDPGVVGQMSLGMLAGPVARVIEHRPRR